MKFLNSVMLRAMHSDLIREYGGSHGIRDLGLLESAIARPKQMENYLPDSSVAQLAAVLGWGLVKNHAFIDGNKRIGLAALVTFLKLNGYRLTCSEVEETAMILSAAASEITEDDFTAWVERSVAPLGS
jgi:death-on-curing protein